MSSRAKEESPTLLLMSNMEDTLAYNGATQEQCVQPRPRLSSDLTP